MVYKKVWWFHLWPGEEDASIQFVHRPVLFPEAEVIICDLGNIIFKLRTMKNGTYISCVNNGRLGI